MIALLLTLACTAEDTEPDTPNGDSPAPPTGSCEAVAPQVVNLTTRDGVALVGDLYSHGDGDHSAVVLLHMIPPDYQRSDWPSAFIDRLSGHCWNVIAIDRRGAGESEGVAEEAYLGDTGRYDVEAAVLRLADEGLGKLAVIGASNGTTSLLDYAVWSAGEGLPVPVAHGFMTGGTYTEAQNAMSAATGWPSIFTYSTAERDWSVDQEALDSGAWSFEEYADGAHGTKMFDAEPVVAEDLEVFLALHL